MQPCAAPQIWKAGLERYSSCMSASHRPPARSSSEREILLPASETVRSDAAKRPPAHRMAAQTRNMERHFRIVDSDRCTAKRNPVRPVTTERRLRHGDPFTAKIAKKTNGRSPHRRPPPKIVQNRSSGEKIIRRRSAEQRRTTVTASRRAPHRRPPPFRPPLR